MEDDDFGDFGDFQTCQKPPEVSSKLDSESSIPIQQVFQQNVNIFELGNDLFDGVIQSFDRTVSEVFPLGDGGKGLKNTVIHSQEDSITECPFWWNLSGSFNSNFSPLAFKKSKSFDLFLAALRSSHSFRDNHLASRHVPGTLPDNGYKEDRTDKVDDNDIIYLDESLASELDMHSLILDSSSQSIYQPGEETLNADRIIEEIENMMSGEEKDFREEPEIDTSGNDPLSLNASSLLNAAIDSWSKYQDLFSDEDDYDAEFRSLPVTINNSGGPGYFQEQNPRIRPSETVNSLESLQTSTATSEMSNSISGNSSFVSRIQQLSIVKLNELLMDLERIVQLKSEILIQELAYREEAENEKELKNTFISALLAVQNKRRLLASSNRKSPQKSDKVIRGDKKLARRKSDVGTSFLGSRFVPNFVPNLNTLKESLGSLGLGSLQTGSSQSPIFLTTIIPYNPEGNPLDSSTLEMLINLLNAMDENSPTVPQLLTDYILKVICT